MRKKRLAEILTIIRENEVENQEMLISLLRSHGYEVTQATVSRDINELGLEKVMSENGVSRYALPTVKRGVRLTGIFSQSVINVDYALNTVVVKCHSGLANAACAAFDVMNMQSVVGTIAGDDTIFILTRTERDAGELTEKLLKML